MADQIDYAEEYRRLHAEGKYFPGTTLMRYRKPIAKLVEQHDALGRLLDYGCGRGLQYLGERVHERWTSGGETASLPQCYDIGIPALATKPEGVFEGVICVDVLEHIPPADVQTVLQELFAYTESGIGFLFLAIACRPAKKSFSNGENLHLTIQPPSWWRDQIRFAAGRAKRPPNDEAEDQTVHVVAHFDVSDHFDEPEEPFEAWL